MKHVFCNVRRIRWDVKWCPVSRITTPLALKRPFQRISRKSRLVRAAWETSTFHNWLLLTISHGRNMTEILPMRRKSLSNQAINVFCIYTIFFCLFAACALCAYTYSNVSLFNVPHVPYALWFGWIINKWTFELFDL